MTDLTTLAGQQAHYKAVRARLWNPTKPTVAIQATPDAIVPQHRDIIKVASRPRSFPANSVERVIRAACEHFGISKLELVSQRRTEPLALHRQAAVYVARSTTTFSYFEIGRRFGNRDHSTIVHSVEVIEKLVASGHPIMADIDAIKDAVANG